jgi:hypothetical protein
MNVFYIFIMRLVLSIVLAFIICRFFFPGWPIIRVMGLAVVMLILSYLFENMRKKEKGEQ